LGAVDGCRSTGPVDRQSNWQLAVGLVRPIGRPTAKGNFCLKLSVAGPVDRQKPESKVIQVGRPVGRPTDVYKRARPGHYVRSTGQAWNRSGRPARSTDRPETDFFYRKFFELWKFFKIIL